MNDHGQALFWSGVEGVKGLEFIARGNLQMSMLPDSGQVNPHLQHSEGVAEANARPAAKGHLGILGKRLTMLWVKAFGPKCKRFGEMVCIAVQRA